MLIIHVLQEVRIKLINEKNINKKEGKCCRNVEYIKYIIIMEGCVLYEKNKNFNSIRCIRNEYEFY